MPRKLKLEGLQAELSSVNSLLQEAKEVGDPLAEYQFEKRKMALENTLSALTSEREKAASVALYFGGGPVLGSKGVSVDFAGRALEQFQELVSRNFARAELGVLGARGPIPLRQSTQLMVTEITRGSFGFVLDELSDQLEIEETALKQMVEEVVDLIRKTASPSENDFEVAVESLDPRSLIALKDFFVTLDSRDATLRMVAEDSDVSLDGLAVHRGRYRTEATSIDERDEVISGLLEGFLPDHKKFELRVSPEDMVYGSVSREAVEQYRSFLASGNTPIGKKWTIRIKRRLVTPLNRPERVVNRLIEFMEQSTKV